MERGCHVNFDFHIGKKDSRHHSDGTTFFFSQIPGTNEKIPQHWGKLLRELNFTDFTDFGVSSAKLSPNGNLEMPCPRKFFKKLKNVK